MFSQLLRGTKGKRYEDMVFKEEGYVVDQNGAYKHKIFDEEYEGKARRSYVSAEFSFIGTRVTRIWHIENAKKN